MVKSVTLVGEMKIILYLQSGRNRYRVRFIIDDDSLMAPGGCQHGFQRAVELTPV